MLEAHSADEEVPDAIIPDAVADLIADSLCEPEPEELVDNNGVDENGKQDAAEPGFDDDRAEQTEQKLNELRTTLIGVKQKQIDLNSDIEALEQQQAQEIVVLSEQWISSKKELNAQLKIVKESHKIALKTLKEAQKVKQKLLKNETKFLETQISQAQRDLKLLSNRGKLELILADDDLIGTLKERWIAAEVAKRLDYPIFMAVSERGGKNTSGDYDYLVDSTGSLVEFPDGHPQEGQLVVNQDLVNYDLLPANLANIADIPDKNLCIAEAFIRFAQEQKLNFWERV